MAKEEVTTSKELAISLVGLVIAIISAFLSLGIANGGMLVFGIRGDITRGRIDRSCYNHRTNNSGIRQQKILLENLQDRGISKDKATGKYLTD
jgi:hypothetical protein